MNRYRKKHHIYTFVLKGKKLRGLCVLILSALIGLGCARLMAGLSGSRYTEFLKFCFSFALSDGESPSGALKEYSSITVDDILSRTVPIFCGEESTITVFNPTGADLGNIEAYAEDIPESPTATAGERVLPQKSVISDNLKLTNTTSYEIDPHSLADTDVVYNASGSEPKVLIMHTHGCESYSTETGIGMGDGESYRSTDPAVNITSIGEIITEKLKEQGINVIHDKTLCDYPSYNNSYKKALGLIDWYKNRYPTIEFVFDIHRDAVADANGTPVKLVYEKSPVPCAQAMIVCGTDAMGLYHPYWKDNLIFALKIQRILEEKYPGFMRPLNLRRERFNMHQTKGSLIFEIGTHANTLAEAENAAILLAEGIGEVL